MVFAIVLACHVPFIFFSGKESLLIMIDEFNRKSISRALQDKMMNVSPLSKINKGEIDINTQLDNEERSSSMAYKEMNYVLYFTATVSMFALEIVGSIVLTDIGMIFEFISAVAFSQLSFILPGAFYLLAERKYGTAM